MMIPHGAQKLLGWFGGYGFAGTMQFFTETMGIPWLFGFLAIMAEFFGGLALLAGALTRLAALGVGIVMLVAAWTSHLQNGLFMNWYGNQAGEGVEFHLLAIAIALALVLRGGGYASLDARLLATGARADRRRPS
jgi:putative oxidoreductase